MLQQFQISREESQRLRDIEERLAAIQEEKTQELELQVSTQQFQQLRASFPPSMQCLINTASDQKLELGKAWEGG